MTHLVETHEGPFDSLACGGCGQGSTWQRDFLAPDGRVVALFRGRRPAELSLDVERKQALDGVVGCVRCGHRYGPEAPEILEVHNPGMDL
jgi:hypothetical protein